jgi:hypothetical protein
MLFPAEDEASLKDDMLMVFEWAALNELTINASKSGRMVCGNEFTTNGEEWNNIPVVTRYTYLGIVVPNDLDIRTVIQDKVVKTRKALFSIKHFLTSRSIPVYTRLTALKTLVLSVLNHGAELIGMHDRSLYKDLQNLMNLGARWVSGVRYGGSHECLLLELGLQPVWLRFALLRARALWKWTGSKTWMKDMANARTGVWAWRMRSTTWLRKQGVEVDLDNNYCKKDVLKAILERRKDLTETTKNWRYFGFQSSTGYLKMLNTYPDLADGVLALLAMRTGSFYNTWRASKNGRLPAEFRKRCSSCNNDTEDSPLHFLLYCDAFAAERHELLETASLIKARYPGMSDIVVVAKLLGGVQGVLSRECLNSWMVQAGGNEEAVEMPPILLATVRFLNGIERSRRAHLYRVIDDYRTARLDEEYAMDRLGIG